MRARPARVTARLRRVEPDHPRRALAGAYHLGAQIRVLNPGSGSSYHPKLYLGARGDRISAVIGSANLTSGITAARTTRSASNTG